MLLRVFFFFFFRNWRVSVFPFSNFNLCYFKVNGNTSTAFSFKQLTASYPSCASTASIPDPPYFSCWARKLLLAQLLQFSQIYSSYLKLFWACMQSGFSAASELVRCILKSSYSASAAGGFYVNLKSELGESPQVPWGPKCISHLRTAAAHLSHRPRPPRSSQQGSLVILIWTESFKSSMKRA